MISYSVIPPTRLFLVIIFFFSHSWQDLKNLPPLSRLLLPPVTLQSRSKLLFLSFGHLSKSKVPELSSEMKVLCVYLVDIKGLLSRVFWRSIGAH